MELEDFEPRPWNPSKAVHEATTRLINSILDARVPEENFYRDESDGWDD